MSISSSCSSCASSIFQAHQEDEKKYRALKGIEKKQAEDYTAHAAQARNTQSANGASGLAAVPKSVAGGFRAHLPTIPDGAKKTPAVSAPVSPGQVSPRTQIAPSAVTLLVNEI